MSAPATPGQAQPTFRLAGGAVEMSVRQISLRMQVSAPFAIDVRARTEDASVDLEALVGRDAVLSLPVSQTEHRFEGVCRQIKQERAEPSGLSTYAASVVPRLWLLTQRSDYRIFQHQTAPTIVRAVLSRWQIEATWDIDEARHPKLHYKVQYGETDYAFLARLLESAGIAYCFLPDEAGVFRLHVSDRLEARAPRPPLTFMDRPAQTRDLPDFVTDVRVFHDLRPDAVSIRDADFRRPSYDLSGDASTGGGGEREVYVYKPGAFAVETDPSGETPVADALGAERHDADWGTERAKRRLRAMQSTGGRVGFRTNVVDLYPGAVFQVWSHPHAALSEDKPLLVVEQSLRGGPGQAWTMSGTAVFADQPFAPPLSTPKPVARGVQSAIVVGPEGEEIHTDEHGRVRVRFPWDRNSPKNEHSSCWLRVSQGWAGAGYGQLTIPRVGQEVLVGFLEGDPDQPIVVGRVFNATQPMPYALPANKTRSTWKSQSTPGGGGFNEIMFEDAAGRELLWIHAQRDMRTLVERDQVTTVTGNAQQLVKGDLTETTNGARSEITSGARTEVTKGARSIAVGQACVTAIGGDEVSLVEGNQLSRVDGGAHRVVAGERREHVGGDSHLTIAGDHREATGGTQSLDVSGDRHERVGRDHALQASNIHVVARGSLVIQADDLTIKAPGGFVRLDAGGVTIVGNLVKINSGGEPGSGRGCNPAAPEAPREATAPEVAAPEAEDLSVTRMGDGDA